MYMIIEILYYYIEQIEFVVLFNLKHKSTSCYCNTILYLNYGNFKLWENVG